MKILSPMTLLLALSVLPAMATPTQNAKDGGESGANVGTVLPPKVRGLLIQEMNAILGASQAILDALVRGQDEVVAEKAQSIHDSFVMKQAMTADDRKALLAAVPKDFLKRDRAFHVLGASLADAARKGDKAAQLRLYRDMISACVECHTRHAQDRFPALNQ